MNILKKWQIKSKQNLLLKSRTTNLPGSVDNVLDYLEAKSIAENIGYPVIIKSTNGGGGRGIKVVLKRKRSEK